MIKYSNRAISSTFELLRSSCGGSCATCIVSCESFCVCSNGYLRAFAQANKAGRGVEGIGFVEGDPLKTVGTRILLALGGVLNEFLRDLRRSDSAIQPYTDVILRCLVSLFLGEEGCIAVRVRKTTN